MRRGVQLALGFGLAALFLWLTLRHVDGAGLIAAARDIAPGWALLAPVLLALGYLCRIRRWHAMLRPSNPGLGLGRSAVAFVGSTAANNLLPLRAGASFGGRFGNSYAFGTGLYLKILYVDLAVMSHGGFSAGSSQGLTLAATTRLSF